MPGLESSGPVARGESRRRAAHCVAPAAILLAGLFPVGAQTVPDYELPPIRYSATSLSNRVTELQRALDAGTLRLARGSEKESLRGCLGALEVPAGSQVLVFSKTSLQRQRISPQTPRALYFSDDCYVGTVPGGLMEVAISDPDVGLAFYRVDPHAPATAWHFERDSDCLSCHAGPLTRQWPSLLVRSVYPDAAGEPIGRAGSFQTGHESPLAERWGGWYVTGQILAGLHLGNAIAHERDDQVELLRPTSPRLTNLVGVFPTEPYLAAESDVVALLVLEHQVGMHNRLVEGALRVRKWLHYQRSLQAELREPVTPEPTGSALRVLESDAQRITEYLLFVGEAPLPAGGVQGNDRFQSAFRQNRHADSQGRSLKDFDLRTRLFQYRCSPLIYSDAFRYLPEPLRAAVYRRLREVLFAEPPARPFDHLGQAERKAIREILLATKPDLAAAWQRGERH